MYLENHIFRPLICQFQAKQSEPTLYQISRTNLPKWGCRLATSLLILALAWLWVLLSATPAIA